MSARSERPYAGWHSLRWGTSPGDPEPRVREAGRVERHGRRGPAAALWEAM